MQAHITIRKIENGFVVGDSNLRNQIGLVSDAPSERFYASEEEVRTAAGDILIGALGDAARARQDAIAQQREMAQRQQAAVQAGPGIYAGADIARRY